MKKRLLSVGAVLIVGLLLVAAVTAVLNRGDHSLCGKFISFVRENNASESYNLYSGSVKTQLTLKSWQQTVSKVSAVYGTSGSLKLISTKPSTDAVSTTEYDYLLKAPSANYNLTCFTTTQGKENAVDGFTSSRQ